MGARSRLSSMIVSVVLMAIIWQVSEMGLFRNMTENFFGKIVVCFIAFLVAQIIGTILSGGK